MQIIRTATQVAAAAALFAAVLAGPVAAQNAACIIYEHSNYKGGSYGFTPKGESRRYSRTWNDKVSSVRVRRGCELTLYEHAGFKGGSKTFDSDERYVGDRWNDIASSSVCDCDRRGAGRPQRNDDSGQKKIVIGDLEIVFGADQPSREGPPPRLGRGGAREASCVLFSDQGFRGRWRGFRDGDDDRKLGRRLSENVSSVKVARGCYAVIDIGREYKLLVDHDISAFGRGANDRAEAVSCQCGGL